jgi:hypothetical protein
MDGAPRFFQLLDTRIVSQSAVSLAHSFNTQFWAVVTVAYYKIHVSARRPTRVGTVGRLNSLTCPYFTLSDTGYRQLGPARS